MVLARLLLWRARHHYRTIYPKVYFRSFQLYKKSIAISTKPFRETCLKKAAVAKRTKLLPSKMQTLRKLKRFDSF